PGGPRRRGGRPPLRARPRRPRRAPDLRGRPLARLARDRSAAVAEGRDGAQRRNARTRDPGRLGRRGYRVPGDRAPPGRPRAARRDRAIVAAGRLVLRLVGLTLAARLVVPSRAARLAA